MMTITKQTANLIIIIIFIIIIIIKKTRRQRGFFSLFLSLSLSFSLSHTHTHTPTDTHTLYSSLSGILVGTLGGNQCPDKTGEYNFLILCQHFSVHVLYTKRDFCLSYLPNPSTRAGYDTRSIFKRSLTGFNSEFSISQTSCFTKAEESNLSYYLPIAGGRIIGFIPFPRVLVLCEMQSVSSRNWTRVVMFNFYDDNYYTTIYLLICSSLFHHQCSECPVRLT